MRCGRVGQSAVNCSSGLVYLVSILVDSCSVREVSYRARERLAEVTDVQPQAYAGLVAQPLLFYS